MFDKKIVGKKNISSAKANTIKHPPIERLLLAPTYIFRHVRAVVSPFEMGTLDELPKSSQGEAGTGVSNLKSITGPAASTQDWTFK